MLRAIPIKNSTKSQKFHKNTYLKNIYDAYRFTYGVNGINGVDGVVVSPDIFLHWHSV